MNRKGITPVVATVLLITIAIGATASAFTFLNSIQKETQEHWEDQLTDKQKESKSEFSIEYAYNSTDGYTLATLRNTGSISIPLERDDQKLFSLLIEGIPEGNGATGWVYNNPDYRDDKLVYMDPQQSITINTTREYPAEGEDMLIEFLGPYSTSSAYVCYNSGGNSC